MKLGETMLSQWEFDSRRCAQDSPKRGDFWLVQCWRMVTYQIHCMQKTAKTAWLIGIYTNEIEYRISLMGYKLTRYFADLSLLNGQEKHPAMVVFSEDRFSNPAHMEHIRAVYPNTLIISLALHLPSDHPFYHHPLKTSSYNSILRLLTSIQEMETRWDN
jgi:hypothetical protein